MHVTESPYLIPFDETLDRAALTTRPPDDAPKKDELKEELSQLAEKLAELQAMMYAGDRYSLLLIFQAMDAAGKDGTIRTVLQEVDPAGAQIFSFKRPSDEEYEHDFLWRTTKRLPERGRIGVFNRSYYEEVLTVRVHPEVLRAQKLPACPPLEELWQQRYDSIRDHERHLARNGTVIIKFWLNVSKEEQRERFLARIDEPGKNWKFRIGDVEERAHWDRYMDAYAAALQATSRPWAPWYAIPADKKAFMRVTVADIIVRTMKQMDLRFPETDADGRRELEQMRERLASEE